MLPADTAERDRLIGDLFDWMAAILSVESNHIGLYLFQGESFVDGWVILDQHDGYPGILALTPDEFAQLQDFWLRHGLPSDLYYPADEQRQVVEPVEMYGGVVLRTRLYSPHRWRRRRQDAFDALRVPTESEQREAFVAACGAFHKAVSLRLAQLWEPGRARDVEVDRRLSHLHAFTMFAQMEAQGMDITEIWARFLASLCKERD